LDKKLIPMRLLLCLLLCVVSMTAQAQYTFVFLNSKPDKKELPKEEVDKIMAGHMANIERLAAEGKLVSAGPFEGGGGIFIFKSASIEETKAWLSTDPGVQAERWNVEVFPFTIQYGNICAAPEPYEMVSYLFVRYNPQVTKFTAPTYPEIFKRHDDYLKELNATGNVLLAGTFGETEGGILIMRGDVQQEVIENDPGVKEMLMEFKLKKLWIAKGSFCEK
jgi:uncharacterized protein YciI